ncbi:hypothetical protein SNEBB_005319 [Seison nebaliae]|nr:hypothetical protein SNEBB_005319 [Seison nebaliae]
MEELVFLSLNYLGILFFVLIEGILGQITPIEVSPLNRPIELWKALAIAVGGANCVTFEGAGGRSYRSRRYSVKPNAHGMDCDPTSLDPYGGRYVWRNGPDGNPLNGNWYYKVNDEPYDGWLFQEDVDHKDGGMWIVDPLAQNVQYNNSTSLPMQPMPQLWNNNAQQLEGVSRSHSQSTLYSVTEINQATAEFETNNNNMNNNLKFEDGIVSELPNDTGESTNKNGEINWKYSKESWQDTDNKTNRLGQLFYSMLPVNLPTSRAPSSIRFSPKPSTITYSSFNPEQMNDSTIPSNASSDQFALINGQYYKINDVKKTGKCKSENGSVKESSSGSDTLCSSKVGNDRLEINVIPSIPNLPEVSTNEVRKPSINMNIYQTEQMSGTCEGDEIPTSTTY